LPLGLLCVGAALIFECAAGWIKANRPLVPIAKFLIPAAGNPGILPSVRLKARRPIARILVQALAIAVIVPTYWRVTLARDAP